MSAFGGIADIGAAPRCKADQKQQSRWRGCMPTALPSSTGLAAPRTASAGVVEPRNNSPTVGPTRKEYRCALRRQKERPPIKQIKICDSSTLRLSGLQQRGNIDSKSALSHFVLKQKFDPQTSDYQNGRAAIRPTAPIRPSCAANRKLFVIALVHF